MSNHPDRFEPGPSDDEFDQLVREQLARSSWPDDEAAQVLADLQPRFAQARLVRRAQLATVATVPLLFVAAGLTVLVGQASEADRGFTVAGQPEEVSRDAADSPDETQEVLAVTGDGQPPATEGEAERTWEGGTAAFESGDAAGEPDDESGETTQPTDGSTAPSSSPTTAPVPVPPTASSTTAVPSTRVSESTSSSVPDSVEVTSACGSIVLRVTGDSVELLDALPEPGYETETDSTGPEVEVSFERRGDECEIHAKVEDDGLVVAGGELVSE